MSKLVDICHFIKDNEVIGTAPVPDKSTKHIRQTIARHLNIPQYDSVMIETFELPENSILEQSFQISKFPTHGILATTYEDYLIELQTEALPLADPDQASFQELIAKLPEQTQNIVHAEPTLNHIALYINQDPKILAKDYKSLIHEIAIYGFQHLTQ